MLTHETFSEVLATLAARGDRPCFSWLPDGEIVPAETLSYAEVLDRALRFATGLKQLGVGPRERVAFFAQPTANCVCALFGTILAGAVAAPINHNFKAAELGAYLAYLEPAVLLFDHDSREVAAEASGGDNADWALRSIDERDAGRSEALNWRAWDRAEPALAAPHDVAMILHTSGTTALPKGVERTQGAMRWFVDRMQRLFFREDDVMLSFSPLYHQSGTLAALFGMLRTGGHTIQWQRFSATRFWEIVDRHRAKVCNLIPPAPTYLLALPPAPDDRAHPLEWVLLGGRTDHWSAFQERFGVVGHSNYGSTEMGFVTSSGERDSPPLPPAVLLAAAPHFLAGPVCPEFEVRIMGPEGTVGAGEAGEIQVRGPTLFERYFRRPDVTAAAFDDGWFRTGDTGYRTPVGDLFMIDRAGDVIRRSSENISPMEIELALSAHPAVEECVAVGVADPVRGQEILACVVRRSGAGAQPGDLFAWCEERLSAFKVPRFIEFWDELPRTGTAKVRKEQLRQTNPRVVRHDREQLHPRS